MAKKVYVGIENFTKRNLPTDYTQIEYIEGNGSQYIDVNFQPNQNTRVLVDVELPAQSSYPTALFGGRNGDTSRSDSYTVWLISATQFQTDFDTEAVKPEIIPVGRFIVDKNKTVTTINGIEYTNTAATFQSNYNLALMTQIDVGGPDTRITAGKLYSAQVWDNDILIRDYVPCVNIDGAVGLYDMVNNIFYSNAGAGVFVAGPGYKGVARKIKKGYLGESNFKPKSLPQGYSQIEYLESSGTQYINTQIKPNQNIRVICDFQLFNTNVGQSVFGAWEFDSNYNVCNAYLLQGQTNNFFTAWYGNGSAADFSTEIKFNSRLVCDMNKNITTIGKYTATNTSNSFSSGYNMYLFGSNFMGSFYEGISAKIWSMSIYDNDNLVRDYVPCINPSGAIGMYDMVSGSFFANAGSGVFVAGPSLTSVAHKIRRGYVGIGGVARPVWSNGELIYYGTITPLSSARLDAAADTVGDYALFAGGRTKDNSVSTTKTVDVYNRSLTHLSPMELGTARQTHKANHVGDYMLVAAGHSGTKHLSEVETFDKSLVRGTATSFSGNVYTNFGVAALKNYALFAGGCDNNVSSGFKNTMNVYDKSLTKVTADTLSVARQYIAGAAVNGVAIFAGGSKVLTGTVYNTVDAYTSSLTRKTLTSLNVKRAAMAGAYVGEHALFAGGQLEYSASDTSVEAYDKSLTKTTIAPLSVSMPSVTGIEMNDYAIFIGNGAINIYDTSLTRTIDTSSIQIRNNIRAASWGDYALIGGGMLNGVVSNMVDAYAIM